MTFTQQLSWWVFGDVRLTTVVAGLLTLGWWYAISRRIGWAVTGTLAWACLYEVLWHWTGLLLRDFVFADAFWLSVAFLGWIALAHTRGFRMSPFVSFMLAIVWALWMVDGFRFNALAWGGDFDPASEIFNVATKGLVAASYVLGTPRPPAAATLRTR